MEEYDNAQSASLDERDARILAAIELLKTALMPDLVSLSPKERRAIVKMGDKSVAFVSKARDYAMTNPHLLPRHIDPEDFNANLESVHRLQQFLTQLLPLCDGLQDTIHAKGSKAYGFALMFYNDLKSAIRAKAHNAREVYADLAERFMNTRRRGLPRRG